MGVSMEVSPKKETKRTVQNNANYAIHANHANHANYLIGIQRYDAGGEGWRRGCWRGMQGSQGLLHSKLCMECTRKH